MTILLATLEDRGRALTFLSDSRISGGVNTESGAKIFSLPIEIVVPAGRGRFRVNYRSAIGFGFSGSTLAALNTHAFASSCLQNLVGEPGSPKISVAQIAGFVAWAAHKHISDLVSRSEDGLRRPERYFFNALIGGYCDQVRGFELYQIQPVLADGAFTVNSVRMELQPERFYPIGSATSDFLAFADDVASYERGAYGTLELFLALGDRDDVGGWIQYGEAFRGGFRLRPTMRPNLEDPSGPVGINFMGFDAAQVGTIGAYGIGYQVYGPRPPVDWIHEALRAVRNRRNGQT